jgi:hypothetical protein
LRRVPAAEWVEALLACKLPAGELIAQGGAPAGVHQALGAARRALREPDQLLPALRALQAGLQAAAQRSMPERPACPPA